MQFPSLCVSKRYELRLAPAIDGVVPKAYLLQQLDAFRHTLTQICGGVGIGAHGDDLATKPAVFFQHETIVSQGFSAIGVDLNPSAPVNKAG